MLYKEDFGEGKNIEFKREIPKRHEKLLKDVIAFSNSTGGKIFIGIEDKTNEVIGIGSVMIFCGRQQPVNLMMLAICQRQKCLHFGSIQIWLSLFLSRLEESKQNPAI